MSKSFISVNYTLYDLLSHVSQTIDIQDMPYINIISMFIATF